MSEDIKEYLTGDKLYGNDFSFEEIKAWHEDEKEGYADLGANNNAEPRYEYHAINIIHGFNYLPKSNKPLTVLGLGSAFGLEFQPIKHLIGNLTILEPSDKFKNNKIFDVPVQYVKPSVDGSMPFDDDSFDLVLCFGVLHHIPNVGKVIGEINRVIKKGGYSLIREPIISMGDWRYPRKGLTKRERGIPLKVFRKIINMVGFKVVRERVCFFRLTNNIFTPFYKGALYNSKFIVKVDHILCLLTGWNINYHPQNKLDKLRPICIFYVLKK